MQPPREMPCAKLGKRSAMPPPPPSTSAKECSMCGDVGFQKELFRCTSCRQRYQHRYCSSFYPNVAMEQGDWTCDWCLLRDKKLPPRKPALPPKATSPKIQQVAAAKQSSLQSPLDCLLVVAENLERDINEASPSPTTSSLGNNNRGGRIRRVMSMPASVKKFSMNDATGNEGMASTATNTSSSVKLLHKRKHCGDMDRDQLRLRPTALSPTAAVAAKPPFSPSPKGVVGRRYRLLSEVLC